uniref:Uncharacterized protein n=1 Tax=Spongospora subterranea TaxID=70186 RepID=A0A0H5QM51_9EUKA|eukprot:CRZ03083.1 hypothetical protein [Spongospora subterranea]
MFTDSVLYGTNPCSMFIFSLLQMSVLLLSSVEVGLLNASTDNSRSCNKYQSFEIVYYVMLAMLLYQSIASAVHHHPELFWSHQENYKVECFSKLHSYPKSESYVSIMGK